MRNDISIIRAAAGAAALALMLGGCASKSEKPDATPYEAPAAAPEAAPTEVAEPVELQENAPLRYVVKKGDTLWGIANKFLKDSWQWPELWYVNAKVKNPHLIYPGDELYLYYVNGAPRLARMGEGEPGGTAGPGPDSGPALPPGGEGAMTPRVRESKLDQAIYAIPLESIRAFLRGPRMIDEDLLDDAPYVIGFETKKLLGGSDDVAYALEVEDKSITQYQVVRRGGAYRDPDDDDVIGYEVVPVGDAEVRVFGDPSTIYLRRATIEARSGDYLLPMEQDPLETRFVPHAPDKPVGGRIISVHDGFSQIGQYQIVAINRGTQHGIEAGHVLAVMQAGREAKDPYSFIGYKVRLPDVKAGTAMVFKTMPRMSYALIVSATQAIHLQDKVEKPEPGQ